VSLADLYNLGGATLDKAYYQGAIAVAQQGLAIEPYGTAIRVRLARSLLGVGKTAEAVKTLEYCLSIDPTGGEAALLLAQVYAQQGHAQKALALLRAVEARAPGQPGIADEIARLEASSTVSP
jgi:tetratricopeptide (TPR) repeat protein